MTVTTIPRETTGYVQKSVTIPADLMADVEEILDGGNLSGYVADALRLRVQCHYRDQRLAEWEAEHGPIPEDEVLAVLREVATV
jgi:hypothetical protein